MDARPLQSSLGVVPDNKPGPITFTALFRKLGAKPDRAAVLGQAAATYFPRYGIMDNPLRLVHLMGQLTHESGGFVYMEEIWGPTPAQARYEGRADLGNTQPGDGKRYKGRGPIQITGRANYRGYGKRLGLDLEGNPNLAADPAIGLRIALEYWNVNRLNALADRDDLAGITKRINGGTNGIDDRRAQVAKIKGWVG